MTPLYAQELTCFTLEELQKINILISRGDESEKLLKLCRDKNDILSNNILIYENIIKNDSIIKTDKDKIINQERETIKEREAEINDLNREIRKQKLFKWLGTGSGFTLAILIFFNII